MPPYGRIAYEAGLGFLKNNLPSEEIKELLSWEQLSQYERDAWDVSARACIQEFLRN